LANLSPGQTVLDLCCYTGGFAIQAARLGHAASVTAVDLDEAAIEVARTNARLNGVSVRFVHVDVFQYLRDLIASGRRFAVVVLDPPKLIRNRSEVDSGTRKHLDLNRLAMQVVEDGGILVTCSCSGLLTATEFMRMLRTASHQADRSVQVLDRTGAAGDHPVHLDVSESEYLQAAWLRINHN
jgi:23S rRNA (cytosine1962-C5)-methyltransferase